MRKQVNENISELLTKVNSTVTYMDGEETLFSRTVRSGSRFADSLNTEKPEKDGFLFLGWVTPDGVHPDPYGYVNTDITLLADFIRDGDATRPDHIFFEPYDRWISINTGGAMLFYVLVPEDVQDTRVSWTVEDPEIAQLMVSSDRIIIIPQKIGDTVITGTMKSGLSESLVPHVYDPEDFPFREFTSAVPAETELTLYVGESGQVKFLLTPENSRPSLIFASDDEETALVEEDFGIVTGIAPGTCRITVRDPFSDVETEFTVIVLERPVPEDGNDPGEAPERTDEEKVPGNPADEKTPEEPAAHDITNMSAGKMQPERTGVRACLGDRKAGHQKGVAYTRSGGQSRHAPDTGDVSDVRIWILLALVSLTGMIGVRRKYRPS